MGVNQTAASPGRLGWLRGRATFVGSTLLLGVITAACTWLAVVSLPGLGSVVAAYGGLGARATAAVDVAVLVLAVLALAGGGFLGERLSGAAVGVGALLPGLGALAAALLPGPTTAVLLALCSVAGAGLLLPALVARAWNGTGATRPGTTLALIGAGFLLANVVVLAGWYATTAWLGLAATAHLLSDGVVGLLPRVLVYETFGTWRRALLVIGGGLVAFAVLSLLAAGSLAPRRIRETLDGFREATDTVGRPFDVPATSAGTTERAALSTWLVALVAAWTAATGLLVYDAAVFAVTAPIMALAGRLVAVPLLLGVLFGGLAVDRAGVRPTLGVALGGAIAGPTLYSAAAGPATETVGLFPAGTPWLVVGLLATGLGVGALLVGLFALPLALLAGADAGVETTAGVVLAAGLATALVARAVVPVDGRATPLVLVALVAPAIAGLVALRSLPDLPSSESEGPPPTDAPSGETE